MTMELEAGIDRNGFTPATATRREVIMQCLENFDKIFLPVATDVTGQRPLTLLWPNSEPWTALRVVMGEWGEDITSLRPL